MKVRGTGGTATPLTGVATTREPTAVEPVAAARSAGRMPDTATIAGIPETELSPKVQAAIGQLMAEVQDLRVELDQARKRINYLEQLADQDSLAPVMNRRAFVRELTRMMAFSERYGVPGSVLYFDVDDMKQINDTRGHVAGDAALKHIGDTLLREVRASDVVGRLGGDEFGVILAQSDQTAATAKAESLAAAIRGTPVTTNGQSFTIDISYGVHVFTTGDKVDDALDAADQAMYAQKRTNTPAAND